MKTILAWIMTGLFMVFLLLLPIALIVVSVANGDWVTLIVIAIMAGGFLSIVYLSKEGKL